VKIDTRIQSGDRVRVLYRGEWLNAIVGPSAGGVLFVVCLAGPLEIPEDEIATRIKQGWE
jgi:hypothetical protein